MSGPRTTPLPATGAPAACRLPRRGLLLAASAAALLAGCGFALRKAPDFAFDTIAIPSTGPIGNELRRMLNSTGTVQVMPLSTPPDKTEVILDILSEPREKVVVGLNASGQVREFQLRLRVRFRLRTPQGRELIPDTELLQQRDVSFNESAVLAKEAEEALLYRDMQNDLVQQLMRRLAAVKSLSG
ncbi:MAG TPA: LPS assembly lipoprotein LptE [Ramlibacter sp.]|jgi:LPS-assembly lipoprotein|uniref:LPS-assembly lipoprotein LptE n=1 Tax=Ramlibacter sp. TaxID=1917967 RepID=UPI002D49D776|nr:LPS assembly lipoprotein LptE [Ramlibacter sp.]HZY17259.1 LPS assembly lipoprotein LptE [Ramlibacter sp.]